jgi:phosphate uptake regulator
MSDPGVKRKFDDLVLQNKKLADKIKDLELTIDDRNKQIE